MAIADKIRQNMAQGSMIRKMFEEGAALMKRYGAENVFDLSLGNPVVEPPPELQQELKRLADEPLPGMHRYMSNAGYPDTRSAVAKQLVAETGLKFTMGEIVMTCGAAAGLNVALKTILNPGDEVIIFAPYFVEYGGYVDNHGGVAKVLPTDENFLPRLNVLKSSITAKTKAVLINSPNNPTGVIYSADLLRQLGDILQQKEKQYGTQIYLISDEAYRKIIYDGLKFPYPLLHHKQTVVVTSHSKDLALPGERIGYIAIHPDCAGKGELVDGLIYANRVLGFVNAPALMQHLVKNLQSVSVSIAEYQQKRDFLYQNLTAMGYKLNKPQGAFYMFPRTPIEDDAAFVRELQEHRILTVPGRGFGAPGYFRLVYCVNDRVLEDSLTGFRKVAEKFGMG